MATNFSWQAQINEHEANCPNCKCGEWQEELLADCETNEQILEALHAQQEYEKNVRNESAQWIAKMTDSGYTGVSHSGSPLFMAEYRGKCKKCGDRFQVGDDIGYVAGKAGPLCSHCHHLNSDYEQYN